MAIKLVDEAPGRGCCTITGRTEGPFLVTGQVVRHPNDVVTIGSSFYNELRNAAGNAGCDNCQNNQAELDALRAWRDKAVAELADYRKLRGAIAMTLDMGGVYDERSKRIRPRAWPGAGSPRDLRKPTPLEEEGLTCGTPSPTSS